MLPPRPLLALSVALVAGLTWLAAVRPAPDVPLAQVARWDGQAVRVEGWASSIRSDATGVRFVLVDGAVALPVNAPAGADQGLHAGDRVAATGRVSRWQGTMRLDADALAVVAGPRPALVEWPDLAAHADRWTGQALRLRGEVRAGWLAGDGAAVALGDGAWPRSGAVEAVGLLRDDPSCLCRRLDASEVQAWSR